MAPSYVIVKGLALMDNSVKMVCMKVFLVNLIENQNLIIAKDPKYSTPDTKIYKTDIQFWLFWAVRVERKNPETAISMLRLRSVFLCFHSQKKNVFEKLLDFFLAKKT